MTDSIITVVIGIVCSLAGFGFGFATYRRGVKNDGARDGTILAEIGYLKGGIDDIKRDLKENDKRYVDVIARLNTLEARVERLNGHERN